MKQWTEGNCISWLTRTGFRCTQRLQGDGQLLANAMRVDGTKYCEQRGVDQAQVLRDLVHHSATLSLLPCPIPACPVCFPPYEETKATMRMSLSEMADTIFRIDNRVSPTVTADKSCGVYQWRAKLGDREGFCISMRYDHPEGAMRETLRAFAKQHNVYNEGTDTIRLPRSAESHE